MAPADIRKEGAAYDLTLAIGIMAAGGLIPHERLQDYIIMGELSLDGTIKPIKGVLPIAIEARKRGITKLILPMANATEAAIVNDIEVFGVNHITEVVDFPTPPLPLLIITKFLICGAIFLPVIELLCCFGACGFLITSELTLTPLASKLLIISSLSAFSTSSWTERVFF